MSTHKNLEHIQASSKELVAQDEAVKILESSFDAQGWPIDLNSDKLWKRYRITSDSELPGGWIVEIERHRSILGVTYNRGLPMSAFETYKVRYAVNVAEMTVRELSEKTEGVEVNVFQLVNAALSSEVFYPSISPTINGYSIFEGVSKEKALVNSFDDVKAFMSLFSHQMSDYFADQLNVQDGLTPEMQQELMVKFHEVVIDKLSLRARQLWDERDD